MSWDEAPFFRPPVVLPGSPRDAAGAEAALRAFIRDRPEHFGGIPPESFLTVLAHSVAGTAGLADTVYVNFKQLHAGLEVEGSFLGFTVRLGREARIVASSARLYPGLDVEGAEEQGTRIMHLGGRWRAVRLLAPRGDGLVAAVDVADGETFAWDERRRADVPGTAHGSGIPEGPIEDGAPAPLALGHIKVVAPDGASVYADAEGRFVVPGRGSGPVLLSLRLSGRYARVEERQRDDLTVSVTARPGAEVRVVFNPAGRGENALAQVNGYVHATLAHDFLARNGVRLAALDVPLPVLTNLDDECNAFYTPRSPSLNLFFSSSRCANTSYGDVIYHEYGHFLDEAAHRGLGDAALSEAIGDILTLLITDQPAVGRGFRRNAEPSWIRHGENRYRYGTSSEAHAQGQAGMGFVWKLRQALIASLGEARGAALATALVLPAILAANRDIPAFIHSVLARDMDEEGAAPHFKEISEAAAAHGIELRLPAGALARLRSRRPRGGQIHPPRRVHRTGAASSPANSRSRASRAFPGGGSPKGEPTIRRGAGAPEDWARSGAGDEACLQGRDRDAPGTRRSRHDRPASGMPSTRPFEFDSSDRRRRSGSRSTAPTPIIASHLTSASAVR